MYSTYLELPTPGIFQVFSLSRFFKGSRCLKQFLSDFLTKHNYILKIRGIFQQSPCDRFQMALRIFQGLNLAGGCFWVLKITTGLRGQDSDWVATHYQTNLVADSNGSNCLPKFFQTSHSFSKKRIIDRFLPFKFKISVVFCQGYLVDVFHEFCPSRCKFLDVSHG